MTMRGWGGLGVPEPPPDDNGWRFTDTLIVLALVAVVALGALGTFYLHWWG